MASLSPEDIRRRISAAKRERHRNEIRKVMARYSLDIAKVATRLANEDARAGRELSKHVWQGVAAESADLAERVLSGPDYLKSEGSSWTYDAD